MPGSNDEPENPKNHDPQDRNRINERTQIPVTQDEDFLRPIVQIAVQEYLEGAMNEALGQ